MNEEVRRGGRNPVAPTTSPRPQALLCHAFIEQGIWSGAGPRLNRTRTLSAGCYTSVVTGHHGCSVIPKRCAGSTGIRPLKAVSGRSTILIEMRPSYFVLALLLAFPAQAQSSNIAGRIAGLDYIATQVPRLDPYFFDHLDRAQFQRAVDDLNARIATISDAEFYVGLAQLMAMAGDAHTSLYLGSCPRVSAAIPVAR